MADECIIRLQLLIAGLCCTEFYSMEDLVDNLL